MFKLSPDTQAWYPLQDNVWGSDTDLMVHSQYLVNAEF